MNNNTDTKSSNITKLTFLKKYLECLTINQDPYNDITENCSNYINISSKPNSKKPINLKEKNIDLLGGAY